MLYRFKPVIISCCCIVFSLWWLGLNNQSLDERVYSRDAHNQDISKIYFYLGRSAQTRQDWPAAIKSYATALQHEPSLMEAYNRLIACYEVIGDLQAAERIRTQRNAHNPSS